MSDSLDFSGKLIKGRIAETIFEQMFRDAGIFTILSFGYENVLPELANRQHDIQSDEAMEIIRRAPDFVIINNENHAIHLVEVKYMANPTATSILKCASLISKSWKPAYLFLATPMGFFFEKAIDVVDRNGIMTKLSMPQISTELQEKYIDLLNRFISLN